MARNGRYVDSNRFETVTDRFETVDEQPRFVDVIEESQVQVQPEVVQQEPSGAMNTLQNIGKVYPVVETAAQFATMSYGLPISGLAGLAGLAFSGGDIEKANEVQQKVAEMLIYQPQTKGGAELAQASFYPFEKLSEVGSKVQEKLDESGHPVAGAIAKTAIEASPVLVGIGAKALRGKAKPAPGLNESIKAQESIRVQDEFRKRFVDNEPIEEPSPLAEPGTVLYGGIPFNEFGNAWIKYVGEPVWDKGVMTLGPKLLEKIPGGKEVNRALLYDYRGDLPNTAKYIASLEAKKQLQSTGKVYAIDLGNRLSSMPESSQLKIGEFLRGGEIKLSEVEMPLAQEARNVLMDLGQQAVEAGLLDERVFFENVGKYMPRLYTSKEYQSSLTRYGQKAPTKLDLSRFKRRQDIPKPVREKMGEILTPGYPVAKGVSQLTHDIATARFFNGIIANQEWALPKNTELPVPEGWKQLPKDARLGKLNNAFVHPEIFADMKQTIKVRDLKERYWRKALGAWKYGKVIASPKTHARNMMSNSVLAHLGGLPMAEQPYYLIKAAKEMRSNGPLWQKLKGESGFSHTYTEGELKALFDNVQTHLDGISAADLPEKFGIIDDIWNKSKRLAKKGADLYEAEEMWYKTAKFIHNVERKKMSPQQAWVDAEKWLFNYSKLTRFQEWYRSSPVGAPFATFTFKALPRIAEATIKYPWRLATPAAIIYGLERAASAKIGDTRGQFQAKKDLRPDYMKGSYLGIPNFARVPVVDDEGLGGTQREYYLNLSYILPWGDIGESGGFLGIPGALMPMSQPVVKEFIEQSTNYDWFWQKPIVKETDTAGKEPWDAALTDVGTRLEHAARTFLPTPVVDVTKALDSLLAKPDYMGRFRHPGVVAADVIGGIKMYPVDYNEQMSRLIGTTDPKKGYIARRLLSEINTLARQKAAVEEKGQNGIYYQQQIEKKVDQLKGLGEEMRKKGETYRKAIGKE